MIQNWAHIAGSIMDEIVKGYVSKYDINEGAIEFLYQTKLMYIDGKFVDSEDGDKSTVIEPSTGGVLGEVPAATENDVNQAVAAAKYAFEQGEWSGYKPVQREQVLHRLADLMEKNAGVLADIESLDAGKAISGCRAVDINASIGRLRYMAGWATKLEGSTRPVSAAGEHFACTLKQPVGVVGAIVPWNWPLSMAMWKLAAALAVGCTVVLKPAQITPLSMLYFAQLCEQAGLPAGALNIVTGSGSKVGNCIVNHPDVRKISFTGSTEVGKTIGKLAMEKIAHVTLELGGKSPMVVFNDADIDRVVNATQDSVFFNTGQVCSAGSRLYIQRGIYESVVEAVAARASNMRLGDPLNLDTEMGPAISRDQQQSVLEYIELGKQEGANLVCGGGIPDRPGYFVEPTVFSDCTNQMRIVQEEIFGPVLVIIPFDTEEEGLRLANDSIYGLGASVFTKDISRAHRIVRKLEAGTVWVNTHDMVDACIPFGGVKQSGIGKDMGPEQLEHFLETKAVWISL